MKPATKQQQDAKTSAAATEASETSTKQAPGKRKASPEQAHETGNETAAGRKNERSSNRSKRNQRKTRARQAQSKPRASETSSLQRTFYIQKNVRHAGLKTSSPMKRLPPRQAAGNGHAIYPKNSALRGSKPFLRRNACKRTRRAKQPATHMCYTKKNRPAGPKSNDCRRKLRPTNA